MPRAKRCLPPGWFFFPGQAVSHPDHSSLLYERPSATYPGMSYVSRPDEKDFKLPTGELVSCLLLHDTNLHAKKEKP
jgi:hypothetical protein